MRLFFGNLPKKQCPDKFGDIVQCMDRLLQPYLSPVQSASTKYGVVVYSDDGNLRADCVLKVTIHVITYKIILYFPVSFYADRFKTTQWRLSPIVVVFRYHIAHITARCIVIIFHFADWSKAS